MHIFRPLVFLALGCMALPAATASAVSRVDPDHYQLISCGKLLDVIEEETLQNQDILVRGSVIEAIGPKLDAPKGAERIDLSDRVCMPGLMDMHVHFFTQSAEGSVDMQGVTQSSAFNALRGIRFAQELLHNGFTTIRSPGDHDYAYANIEIRNAINRGEFAGPRYLVAPHYISALGGHGDFNSFAPDRPPIHAPMIADGVDQLRAAVRKEIKYGADWIKVMASGGVMSQHDDPEVAAYSEEEFRVLAEETHRHKKKITAHAHGDAGVYAAVKAGFDSIEHATMMSERTAKLMAKKGTYYVPTTYVLDWILDMGATGGISPDNLAKAQMVAKQHGHSIAMAYKYKVPMVIGSDCIFPMKQAIREFTSMAKRIDDNWYVLRAGTIHPAGMLGLENEIGSLEVGKQADIVATAANPIDDMANIQSVNFVMKGGELIRQ